jgi:hypothetical protein
MKKLIIGAPVFPAAFAALRGFRPATAEQTRSSAGFLEFHDLYLA